MIISRTPFRVSFVGGGSDLPAFYRRWPGAVVSAAIDKYMYVTVSRRFDESIRVSYTKTEIVDDLHDLQHEIIREAMRLTGVTQGVEITTIANIPAGTGLASSSSLAVGVLNALYAFQGRHVSAGVLAREACEIEIGKLGKPIGKQDQYAAAYGGFNYIRFNTDETVEVEPVICQPDVKRTLARRLLLFYTGLRGDNDELLSRQSRATASEEDKAESLKQMVAFAADLREAVSENNLDSFGDLLHRNWLAKKELTKGISNESIDRWYEAGRKAGAVGGKILGAGSGGFLLFYCLEQHQPALRAAMEQECLSEFPADLAVQGSSIVFVGEDL